MQTCWTELARNMHVHIKGFVFNSDQQLLDAGGFHNFNKPYLSPQLSFYPAVPSCFITHPRMFSCVGEPAPQGLYLHGGVGSGKTMLMDLFYDASPTTKKKRVHFYSFMLHVYSEVNRWNLCCPDNEETFDITPIQSIASNLSKETQLLCFDEVQVTDFASTRLLEGIFRNMLSEGLVIVATSNRSPADLGTSSFGREGEAQESLSSLVGLLNQHCEIVSLDSGIDYRASQQQGNMTYFYPITEQAERLFNQAFCEAVGTGNQLTHMTLPVYGRNVIIPVASVHGVARFNFDELCRNPLGPPDYITICNYFHTIFVEDIPQLNISQKNEARRFLSFIDAAYESRVKVFCTAASPPEEMFQLIPSETQNYEDKMHLEMIGEMAYDLELTKLDLKSLGILTGEDEIFSFKRCISRLKEMQSKLYQSKQHCRQDFAPYIGTLEEQKLAEQRRQQREQERQSQLAQTEQGQGKEQDKLPLTPLTSASTDWGDEASYIAWSNDALRRGRLQLERENQQRMKHRSAPKFREEHFWGFGWWENVIKRKKEQDTKNDTDD